MPESEFSHQEKKYRRQIIKAVIENSVPEHLQELARAQIEKIILLTQTRVLREAKTRGKSTNFDAFFATSTTEINEWVSQKLAYSSYGETMKASSRKRHSFEKFVANRKGRKGEPTGSIFKKWQHLQAQQWTKGIKLARNGENFEIIDITTTCNIILKKNGVRIGQLNPLAMTGFTSGKNNFSPERGQISAHI